jgi:hypothetical protein
MGHFEDLDTDERMMLRCNLKNRACTGFNRLRI